MIKGITIFTDWLNEKIKDIYRLQNTYLLVKWESLSYIILTKNYHISQ